MVCRGPYDTCEVREGVMGTDGFFCEGQFLLVRRFVANEGLVWRAANSRRRELSSATEVVNRAFSTGVFTGGRE